MQVIPAIAVFALLLAKARDIIVSLGGEVATAREARATLGLEGGRA